MAVEPLAATDPRQAGRYRLTGRLGSGGMGRVCLGRSPSGRYVAVTMVRPELADAPGVRRRSAREVAAARKVTGFVTAAVVAADPDGSPPWLATAYVPGRLWGAYLSHTVISGGLAGCYLPQADFGDDGSGLWCCLLGYVFLAYGVVRFPGAARRR